MPQEKFQEQNIQRVFIVCHRRLGCCGAVLGMFFSTHITLTHVQTESFPHNANTIFSPCLLFSLFMLTDFASCADAFQIFFPTQVNDPVWLFFFLKNKQTNIFYFFNPYSSHTLCYWYGGTSNFSVSPFSF